MQFAITRTLLASAFLASIALAAGATKTQPKQQQQQQQQEQAQQEQKPIAAATKLKRDAGLSFGSGLYHGPSHKYLPPSFASSGGYESTYGTLHGNGLASSSGFDFASLDTDSGSHQTSYQNLHHHSPYHHYSQQPHSSYQSLASHHGHGRPVYISSASHGGGGYHSQHQHPHHHRAQSPKVETYIVQTSSGGGSSGAGHGHQHQHQGHGIGGSYNKYSAHGGGNSILSLLGGAHKQLHGSTSTYLIASPSYSSGSGSSHGLGLGHGSSSSHSFGQHYASGLSHALEQQEHFQLPEHSGYSYETPSFKQQPLSSYGVPLLPSGYEHESAADHHHHHHHELEHQEHGLHKLHTEQAQSQPQPPAYALGHKGLGHFSYTSSKPLALNTDVHQLSHTAHEDHNEQQQQQLVAEFTKSPPFKPSAFLGAKHEPSTGYDYATQTSQQYLQAPPTAPQGYDYPAPAVLYGAPGQSGDSATPIFEAPDATYLPPVSSYATPTHSYH